MGLPGRGRSLTISSAVWIQCTNVTDRQTDGRTPGDSKDLALAHSVTREKLDQPICRPTIFLRGLTKIFIGLICQPDLSINTKTYADKLIISLCRLATADRSRVNIRGRPCKIFLKSSLITMQILVVYCLCARVYKMTIFVG